MSVLLYAQGALQNNQSHDGIFREKVLVTEGKQRLDQAQIDELVAKRLDTLRHLAPAFEEDFKFDGIDDEALFRQAFTNLTGSEPREDAEPAYINGVVDGLLSRLDEEDASEEEASEEAPAVEEPARADSTVELREALSSTQRPSTDSSTTSYRARMADAWKQPLTASK